MYTDFKPKFHDASLPGSPLRLYQFQEEFHSYKKGLEKEIFRGKALTTTKHSLDEQNDDLNNERRSSCLQTLHWKTGEILCSGHNN